MTVTVLLELRFKPDEVGAGRELMGRTLQDTRAFDGNLGTDVLVDQDDPYYAVATEMLGRCWAAGVLRALITGPARFSEIAAAIPSMTDKLLSQRLKDLEADGLVERLVHAGPPVRVEYRLTEKGAALSTILLDLNRWALKWIDLPADH